MTSLSVGISSYAVAGVAAALVVVAKLSLTSKVSVVYGNTYSPQPLLVSSLMLYPRLDRVAGSAHGWLVLSI